MRLVPTNASVYLIVDSTGLTIVGEGEWTVPKHGDPRQPGWKKRHFSHDRAAGTVGHKSTEATAGDTTTGISLIAALAAAGTQRQSGAENALSQYTSLTGAVFTLALQAAARR